MTDPMIAAVSTCLIAASCALVFVLERLVGIGRLFGGEVPRTSSRDLARSG